MNWTHYRTLIQISDPDKREYYELEAAKNSLLYERLLKSSDKEAVLAVARKERIPSSPSEVVKDPMYLEFLGLEQKPHYYEIREDQFKTPEKEIKSALQRTLHHFREVTKMVQNTF